jgi:renalase
MTKNSAPIHIAVIGTGMSGATCASSLQHEGFKVTVLDKSRCYGGRMASRRVSWIDDAGAVQVAELDQGAQSFTVRQPRFRALISRAEAMGLVSYWAPHVHTHWPVNDPLDIFLPLPNMKSLPKHLLANVPAHLAYQAQRLERSHQAWYTVSSDGQRLGPFSHVVLAMPPAQAATLLAGHHDVWANTLAAVPSEPCWTLMAVTEDINWSWDIVEPESGPFASVTRHDRKPGRTAPVGCSSWIAHASADWSAEHLDDDPQAVNLALQEAMATLFSLNHPLRWCYSTVHRWRYAAPAAVTSNGRPFAWDEASGLGVCGDYLGGGNVEGAWHSGDELADTMAMHLEKLQAQQELEPTQSAVAA